MKLSIVIPAYNEEKNIGSTIEEVISQAQVMQDVTLEVIVVDDHSSDKTFEAVSTMRNPQVRVFRLSKRSGSHIAIRAGLAQAKGNAVVCISADGQDSPAAINAMLKKWQQGAKIVWALRKARQEPFISAACAKLFYKILKWLDKTNTSKIDFPRADFYLLDKKAVEALNGCPERNTSLFGLIAWLGFTQDYVEYDRRVRKSGKSKWDLQKRLLLAGDWIIAFSGLPLRLMSIIGFSIALLGFLYALFIIVGTLFTGNPVEGWASTMVVILMLGGLNIFMLGIVGEYLWRTLDESRKRPLYFVEEKSE